MHGYINYGMTDSDEQNRLNVTSSESPDSPYDCSQNLFDETDTNASHASVSRSRSFVFPASPTYHSSIPTPGTSGPIRRYGPNPHNQYTSTPRPQEDENRKWRSRSNLALNRLSDSESNSNSDSDSDMSKTLVAYGNSPQSLILKNNTKGKGKGVSRKRSEGVGHPRSRSLPYAPHHVLPPPRLSDESIDRAVNFDRGFELDHTVDSIISDPGQPVHSCISVSKKRRVRKIYERVRIMTRPGRGEIERFSPPDFRIKKKKKKDT